MTEPSIAVGSVNPAVSPARSHSPPPLSAQPSAVSSNVGNRRANSPLELAPSKRQKINGDIPTSTGPLAPLVPVKKGKGGRRKKAPSPDRTTTVSTPVAQFPPNLDLPSTSRHNNASTSTHPDPSSSKEPQTDGTIRCICQTHWDDGQMVQCDRCQTWQHTKCYKQDFAQVAADDNSEWVCVVCDQVRWEDWKLDPIWAARLQKKEEERERFAQVNKALGDRGRRRGRKPNQGAIGGPLSATEKESEKSEEHDEAETWRRVFVSLKSNVVDRDVKPLLHSFYSRYGPGSKFFESAIKTTGGWIPALPSTDSRKGKARDWEVEDWDVMSRSMPIIITNDELKAAEEDIYVTVRSRHVPPPPPPPPSVPIIIPNSPTSSRTAHPTLVIPHQHPHQSTSGPSNAVVAHNDYSYANVFRQTVAQNATATSTTITTASTSVAQVHRNNSRSPPAQPNRSRAASPPRRLPSPSPGASKGKKATTPVPGVNGENPPLPPIPSSDGVPQKDPYAAQTYSLHATHAVPAKTLLTLYPSHVMSHQTYLSQPSNQYYHLGLPKPHVHLLGAPVEVALDGRALAGVGRFARSGCWPNAAIRAVITKRRRKGKRAAKMMDDGMGGIDLDGDNDNVDVLFGIFSIKEIAEGEEIVLGWEWDDGHRAHNLPRLLVDEAKMMLDSSEPPFRYALLFVSLL